MTKNHTLNIKCQQKIFLLAPSVGTLLVYLETTAKIIFFEDKNFFVFQDRKLKLLASV